MTAGSQVRVLRTVEEVEKLRYEWDAVRSVELDADLDYFLEVVRSSEGSLGPHVLVLDREERPPVIVVARLVRERLPLRVGYQRVGTLSRTVLLTAFDGILGARDDADLTEAVDALEDQLRQGLADLLWLPRLEVGSRTYDHLLRRPGSRWHAGEPLPRWFVDLPDSWDALLQARSGSSRQKLRADDRRFERAFPDRIAMRRLDLPEHRDRLWSDMERVHATSYQHALGVGLGGTGLERALMAAALERGDLRVWMLYIDDAPVAFWSGISHGGHAFLGTTAYDPAFAQVRAGYYAMRRMIADLCADPAVSSADFGYGDADYKQRFGTRSTQHSDLTLYSRRPAAAWQRMLLESAEGLTRWGRRLADRTGRTTQLKRRMRARAVAAQGPHERPTGSPQDAAAPESEEIRVD